MMFNERCKIAARFCRDSSCALFGFGLFGLLACFMLALMFPSVARSLNDTTLGKR